MNRLRFSKSWFSWCSFSAKILIGINTILVFIINIEPTNAPLSNRYVYYIFKKIIYCKEKMRKIGRYLMRNIFDNNHKHQIENVPV